MSSSDPYATPDATPEPDATPPVPADVVPPPGRPRTTAGKVITAIGGVLLLLSIIGGIAAGWGLVRTAADVVDHGVHSTDGTAVLDVAAGETRMILVEGGTAEAACTVLGPGERPISIQGVGDLELNWGNTEYRGVGRFTSGQAGSYTIECDRDVLVSPDLRVGAFAGGIVGVVIAVLTGTLGMVLLVGGIIVWIVQASRH